MKHSFKRTLSLLMALVMALSCMSLPAFATGTECNGGDDCDHVAAIGDMHYATLADAIAAVPANAEEATTITLLKGVTLDSALSISNKTLTLNLNEKTITGATGHSALDIGASTVTLTGSGGINATPDAKGSAIRVHDNSTLNYLNGTLTVSNECGRAYGIFLYNQETVNLGSQSDNTGPSITVTGPCLATNGSCEGGTFNVYGGTYTSTRADGDGDSNVIQIANDASVVGMNTVNIYGGTFTQTASPEDGMSNVFELRYAGPKSISIFGGSFNSNGTVFHDWTETDKYAIYNLDAVNKSISITGGTYTADPTAYLAEGYTAYQRSDNKWVVVGADNAVASITRDTETTYYATLRDALDTIPANNTTDVTIKLLKDIQLPWSSAGFNESKNGVQEAAALNIDKNYVTIDGQNFTISTDVSDEWNRFKETSKTHEKFGNYNLIKVTGKNVTVQNVTVDGGSEYRGVSCMTTKGGQDVTYQNVTMIGRGSGHYYGTANGKLTFKKCTINTKGYAIHCSGGGTAYDLVIEDCSLYGWNSCGSASSLTIRDTKFYGANDEGKNGLLAMLRPYCPTTITDCKFSEDFFTNPEEKDFTGIGTGAVVTVALNSCTVPAGYTLADVVDYDAFEDEVAANGSVFAIDATKNDGDKYTGGTFVTKSTVSDVAEGYQAYPVAENVYKVLPVVSTADNTPSDGKSGTAAEGNTTATATEVVTVTGTEAELLSYKVEVTKGGAAQTVYVAPPAVDVNDGVTVAVDQLDDPAKAALVASVAAKAVAKNTTTASNEEVAQAAVNSIESYDYGSKATDASTTVTGAPSGAQVFDAVPTRTALDEDGKELGSVVISALPAGKEVNVTIDTGFSTADYADFKHYKNTSANSDLAQVSDANIETFKAKLEGGVANFKASEFSIYTAVVAVNADPYGYIVETDKYGDTFKELADAATSGQTIRIIDGKDYPDDPYTLTGDKTLKVTAADGFNWAGLTIETDSTHVLAKSYETNTDGTTTYTFKSVPVSETVTPAVGTVAVADANSFSEGTRDHLFDDYTADQYVKIPVTINAGDLEVYGVRLVVTSLPQGAKVVGFTFANEAAQKITDSTADQAIAAVSTDNSSLLVGDGNTLGYLVVKFDATQSFNNYANATVTLTPYVSVDANNEEDGYKELNGISASIPVWFKISITSDPAAGGTFDADNSSVAVTDINNVDSFAVYHPVGDVITISDPQPANRLYKFANITLGSGTATVTPSETGGTVTVGTSEADVKVNFTPIAYNVKYAANKPSGVSAEVQGMPNDVIVWNEGKTEYLANLTADEISAAPIKGVAYALSDAQPTLFGYTFLGWNTEKTATTVLNPNTNTLPLDSTEKEVTFYAIWQPKEYTVTLSINGNVSNTIKVQEGKKITDAIKTADPAANWTAADLTTTADSILNPANYLTGWNYTAPVQSGVPAAVENATSATLADVVVYGNFTATAQFKKIMNVVGGVTDLTDDLTITGTNWKITADGSHTAKITGFENDSYWYTVTVTSNNVDDAESLVYTNDAFVTSDSTYAVGPGGVITVSDSLLNDTFSAGATLTFTVTTRVKVTVKAYPYSNNLILITATSGVTNGTDRALTYSGEQMYLDNRFSSGDKNVFVALIEYKKAGFNSGVTMADVKTAVEEYINDKAVAPTSKFIAPVYNVHAGKNANVPDDPKSGVNIVDVTLVYNAYTGTYTYSASAAKHGLVSAHDTQYLLSDVTLTKNRKLDTLSNSDLVVPVTNPSATTQYQLLNMDDVREEYKVAYPPVVVNP